MMGLLGHEVAFNRGRAQLKLLANLTVTTKAVERTAEAIGRDILARQQQEIRRARQLELPVVAGPRIPILYIQTDGTGVPVTLAETQNRQGKQPGQPAHTREAKLGCVFTQTATDAEGRPVRDADSTSYVGAMETAEEFGLRLYAEAWRRGWDRAALKVFMGDGAVRIWNIGDRHFPGAVQIVDLYVSILESRSQAVSQRCCASKAVDHGSTRQARQWAHRKPPHFVACAPPRSDGSDRYGSYGGWILRGQRQTYAVPGVPETGPVCRDRGHGGWL